MSEQEANQSGRDASPGGAPVNPPEGAANVFWQPQSPSAAGLAASEGWVAPGVPIDDLEVEATVYVGGGVYPLSTLAGLRPGSILPLTTEVGEPVVIAINGRVIAVGEVMVTADQTLAVRLTRVTLGDEGRAAAPAWLRSGAPAARRTRGEAGGLR